MKVILATDGSKFAEEASRFLAHLPHSEKLDLTVLFVSNVPNLHGAQNSVELIKAIESENRAKASAIFESTKSIFEGANATLALVVKEGHIGTAIVRAAEAIQCDLIVIGAVGHSLIERMFGSTSDFVATHAKCSVLVVRPTGLDSKSNRPIEICIAHDDKDQASVMLEQLAQFGWGANTKMDLVNIVTIPFSYSDIPIVYDMEAVGTARRKLLQAESDRFREQSPSVKTHVVEANHTGDGLVQFATQIGSDIILMGSTGGGMISDFLLGSVSKYVLRHSKSSVWIARKKKK